MKAPRPGFTFVEVLFAVMILGIGFIMIAGIFPVAINQTQLNSDETVGAALARNGVHYLEQLPYSQYGPLVVQPDGMVHSFDGVLFGQLAGNLISPEDTRYAWVPFYRRNVDLNGQPSTSAQVIVVACRSRVKTAYEPAADLGNNSPLAAKLVMGCTLTKNAANFADSIRFPSGPPALAPGTFVIVAVDKSPTANQNITGWVFRVGSPTNAGGTLSWDLVPGMDLKSSGYKQSSGSVDVYFVGQAPDPNNPGTFAGGAQDVAVYASFIQLK